MAETPESWNEVLTFLGGLKENPKLWDDDSGVVTSAESIQSAMDYCETSMLEEQGVPKFIVPDSNGGLVIEHKRYHAASENDLDCAVNFWSDGLRTLFVFFGTKVIDRQDWGKEIQ